jgi:double zinc ribbon protein
LVHLICLRCSRANVADARFCSQCGAGLLRKFCGECHAVNDAESHFCQSCGAALLSQPPAPATMPASVPPEVVPQLTDVAYAPEPTASPGFASVSAQAAGVVELPPRWQMSTVRAPAAAPSARTFTYRPALLLGFTGAAAALLVVASWPRFDRQRTPASEPAAVPAAAVATTRSLAVAATPMVAPAAVPVAAVASAVTASDRGEPPVAAPVVEPNTRPAGRPIEARATPEALLAAQPPAAGPPRVAAPEHVRAVRSTPPTPVTECTPQADALGLCAPGASVTGR